MHMDICVIAKGDTKEEAIEAASSELDTLVEWGKFDYYNVVDAIKANTKKGKKMLVEYETAQRAVFDDALCEMRNLLRDYSDDELYEKYWIGTDSLRFAANTIGSSEGPSVWTYGVGWGGLTSQEDFDRIKKEIDGNTWLVIADVHH